MAYGVAIQSDGRIVVSGVSFVGNDRSTADFALARYGPDGILDPTFGSGGIVLTDFGGASDSALGGVAIQPNGTIVASGTVNSNAEGTIADFGLARYEADGSLDQSFGDGGTVVSNITDHRASTDSMVLQPDGKIVLGGGSNDGMTVARYETDGSLDASFGNGGVAADLASGIHANDLALQSDGRVVVVAVATALTPPSTVTSDFALARVNTDGSLDTTFGSGGMVIADIGDDDFPPEVAIQTDGKIVVAGNSFGNTGGNIVLARYNPNGSLDPGFGTAGISLSAPFVDLVAMALQPDGKIVAGGIGAGDGGGQDMALARYQSAQAPAAITFAPTSGPEGWPVSISGRGLTGTLSVTFHGMPAGFTVDSDTHITAMVPVAASTGSISVITPAGALTSTVDFAVAAVGEGILPVEEFPVDSVYGPGPIAASSGGKAWFALPNDDAIARINRRGKITLYPLPSPFQEPRGIAKAKGGRAWFTQTGSHTGGEGIGLIDRKGTITEFELPENTQPFAVAKGPDGNLWFTEAGPRRAIGRVTPTGEITEFPFDLAGRPLNIVAGPDGAMWFTEDSIVAGGSGAIGRITRSGQLTEYLLPTLPGYASGAGDITVGPDGNLWFTWAAQPPTDDLDAVLSSVGRITPEGVITEFPVSVDKGWPPGGICRGRDGHLWLTHGAGNAIVRISVTGSVTSFPLPTADGFPIDITRGNRGVIWFSEDGAIGRFVVRKDGTFVAPE
jgi:uncharacterized delta-60 repeat protein